MSKHEHVDEIKGVAMQPNLKFLDLYADIKGFPQTQPDLSDTVFMKRGVLPKIEITDSSNQYRTGKPATGNDFAEAGVTCKRSIQKDGAHTTTVDYGNGVVISSTEGGKPTELSHDQKVTVKHNISVTILGDNVEKEHGIIEDAKGRVIAKRNEDGGYTVDTGTGAFFTQRADGTVRKETALRTRRPHEKVARDFEVIDTETPLGKFRPSDMTAAR
jgi:hypothetical protein